MSTRQNKLLSLVFIFIITNVACTTEMRKDKSYTNSIGMNFVRIEPGSFQMGSEKGQFDEQPVHQVVISQPFQMGMHEVTNAQYEQFDPDHRRFRGRKGFSKDDDEAVFFVSWNDAMAFCRWLTQKEQRPYRLPTEAQWEYVCRAGTNTEFSTGNELPEQYLTKTRHGEHDPHPAPLHVGRTQPNPWGISDMHGNLEEWCLDWYGPYESGSQKDPVGRMKGDFRITRGGSHSAKPKYLRSANRMGTLPEDKHWLIGFRVVLGDMPRTDPEPSTSPQLYQMNVKQEIPADIDQGPDRDKPYFRGPRPYVRIKDTNGPFYRHNHDPALTLCPNGDLLAIWYTTPEESERELSIAASRLRHGADQWEPASQFWNAPDPNDHAPALWTDTKGKIYHFNGLAEAESFRFLALIMRTSTDNGVTWSPARLIDPVHDFRHQPIDSVIQSRDGSIILLSDATMHTGGGSVVWISNDAGLTWNCLSQGRPRPTFAKGSTGAWIAGIHAGIVQLNDSRLFTLGRSDSIDGMMPISISSDMGRNWTYSASPFQPIGGGQRLVLNRLSQGHLFFASFCRDMQIVDASGAKRKVSGLYAALSFDEGRTWPVRRLVSDDGPDHEIKNPVRGSFTMGIGKAERGGYMSGVQTRNGLIHLITSNNHYAFNLKWLMTLPPAP